MSGKTDAGIAWLVRWIYHPKFRALVIRQHADDLKDWVDRARAMYATCGGIVVGNPAEIRFPSGAKIRLGHLRDDNAFQKYQGHEYHKMVIEELTQIPREEDYLKLISSCRSTIPELKPQIFCTANPGGCGMDWVKKRFVVNEPYKVFSDEITHRTRIFIPATIEDNPTLMKNDPNYVTFLEGLPENLKKAWRYGDWNVFTGQFFSEWNQAKHTCEPFTLPESWAKIRTIDHGRTAPTACLWGAIDFDGKIYWYREYYQKDTDADINAKNIIKLSGDEKYKFTLLDSACFSKTGYGETIADIYNKNGVFVMPSPKNRIAGWTLFHEYLRIDENTKQPKMFFFKNCYNAIRSIPTMIHSETHPEDLESVGTEDHLCDCLSYSLQYLNESKTPKPLSEIDKRIKEIKQKSNILPNKLKQLYGGR